MRRAHALTLLAVGALAGIGATPAPAADHSPRTPIHHVISLMQENHTYDNYFGTYPRGDGLPEGVCMPFDPEHPKRGCVKPFRIGSNDIEPADLDHSAETARRQFNHGRMDGFVHALDLRNQDGRLAMGYYDDRELPYYWNLADRYVVFDRLFASSRGGSFLNHVFWVASGPGEGLDGVPDADGGGLKLETIFDRLERAGVSWKFYVQNYEPKLTYRTRGEFSGNQASQVIWVPLLNIDRFIDDPKLNSHIVGLDQYFRDLDAGTLPAVAYIIPSGPSEHPPSRPSSGEAFVRSLINGLMRSSAWKSSAFMVTYDDWGGWYDHVRPKTVDAYGLGFRVAGFLVSPYAKVGYTDSTQLEFGSIPQFIAENWRLGPFGQRRPATIAGAFDFSRPPRRAALIPTSRTPEKIVSIRRKPIVVLYGGALLGAVVLLSIAARRSRRREPQAPAPRSIGDAGAP